MVAYLAKHPEGHIHRSVYMRRTKPHADLGNMLHQLAASLQDQMQLKTFTDKTSTHHNAPFMKARLLLFSLSLFYECSSNLTLSRT